MKLLEYHEVDINGKRIAVKSFREGVEVPPYHFLGWGDRKFFDPKWDFELEDWVEGLPPEEVIAREEELQNQTQDPLTFQKLNEENEMNALAIMELAQISLGG